MNVTQPGTKRRIARGTLLAGGTSVTLEDKDRPFQILDRDYRWKEGMLYYEAEDCGEHGAQHENKKIVVLRVDPRTRERCRG